MLRLFHLCDQLEVVWEVHLLVQIHVKDLVVLGRDGHVRVLKLLVVFVFANRKGSNVSAFELRGSPLEEADVMTFSFVLGAFLVGLKLEEIEDII